MSEPARYSVLLLSRIARFLDELTPEHLQALVDDRARLALVSADVVAVAETRPGPRKVSKSDPNEIVRMIRTMSSEDDTYTYLESLPRGVSIDVLMAIAHTLNLNVRRSAQKKPIWRAIAGAWATRGDSAGVLPLRPSSAELSVHGQSVEDRDEHHQPDPRARSTRELESLAITLPTLATRDAVVERLEQEGLTADEMKELARVLRITVPSGRTRAADIRSIIAEATVGYRLKAEAIFQGTWPK